MNTFDNHEGKVWALDVLDNQFISGDNDSQFHIWQDCTEEMQNEKLEKE